MSTLPRYGMEEHRKQKTGARIEVLHTVIATILLLILHGCHCDQQVQGWMKVKKYRNVLFDAYNLFEVRREDEGQCLMSGSGGTGRVGVVRCWLEEVLATFSFFVECASVCANGIR